MKKSWPFFLAMFFLFLTGCSNGHGNTLLEHASPDASAMEFYVYDGDTVTRSFLYDSAKEKEIIQKLSSVKIKKAEDHSPKDVTLPIYGIGIGGADGQSIQAAWSNGYWIDQAGEAYLFDYDLSSLAADYEWTDPDTWTTVSVLPCARHLCQDGSTWYAPLLTPAEGLTPPQQDITLSYISQTEDTITAAFSNQGDEEWIYGEYFSLDVQLDGVWYNVPPLPGDHGVNDIACILPAGAVQEESYDLSMYGELPEGTYRLVAEGLVAEFQAPVK